MWWEANEAEERCDLIYFLKEPYLLFHKTEKSQ